MDILTVVNAFSEHWESLAIFAFAAGGLWQALKQKAFKLFFLLALEMVRKVAVEELSGKEKRDAVVEAAYAKLPIWAKKVITVGDMHLLAEQAYLVLRGELKTNENKE